MGAVERILFVEPQFAGLEHSRFNGQLIESFRWAAPSASLTLASAEVPWKAASACVKGQGLDRLPLDPITPEIPKAKALSLSLDSLRVLAREASSHPGTLVVFLGMSRIMRLAALLHRWPSRVPVWSVVHEDYQEIGDGPVWSLHRTLFSLGRKIRPILIYPPEALPRRDQRLIKEALVLPHPLPPPSPLPLEPPQGDSLQVGLFGTGSRYVEGLEEVMAQVRGPLRRTRFRALHATRNPDHLARLQKFAPEASSDFTSEEEASRLASQCHLSLWIGDRKLFRARASAGLVDPLAHGLPLLAWECPFSRFMSQACSAIRVLPNAASMARQLEEWDESLGAEEWRVMAEEVSACRSALEPPQLASLIRSQSPLF